MLWKRTIIMLLAFVALTVSAILSATVSTTKEGPVLQLPAVNKDDITKIEAIGGKNPVTLEKKSDGWKVMSKAADENIIKTVLDTIAGLSFSSMISNNPGLFEKYAVSDKDMTIVVSTSKGEAWRLIVGKGSSDNRGNYVRLPNDNKVFVSIGRLGALFERDVNKWRDRTIVKADKDKATQLSLTDRNGAGFSFKKEDNKWVFDPVPDKLPPDYKLDSQKVDSAVRAIASLNAADFVDSNPPLADMGLDPPLTKATLNLSDGSTITVLAGTDTEQKFYAKIQDKPQIYLVGSYQKDKLHADLETFRDLHITSFDPEKADRMEFREGSRKLIVVKSADNGEWKLEETTEEKSKGFVFDPEKVKNFVSSLSKFQAKKIMGRSAPANAGLSLPKGTITVHTSDGVTKIFKIGNEAGEKQAYLTGDDGFVYIAAKGAVDHLLRTLSDFKVTGEQQQVVTPDMLKNLPPGIAEQVMQQQKQKIMQNQMFKQMMKKSESQKQNQPAQKK